MLFAFSYPFMKRFTYWPQLFLGFTFNWGIIMAWTAMTNEISYLPVLLYLGAIFWTLGYDTMTDKPRAIKIYFILFLI